MEQRESALSNKHVSNNNTTAKSDDQMQLPPGFRFHPTDEELITHYLSQKAVDAAFNAQPIGEVDLNKCEPWELPRYANLREDELYFFCVRDRKYPTGLRTNRATSAGYWKATGKDKEIHRMKSLVGMKKTLVFYTGRAPRGEKTNWVMHEYRLNANRAIKNDWVLCRIFKKSAVGIAKKGFGEQTDAAPPPNIPPLEDLRSHVPCFSNAPEGQNAPDPDLFDMSSVFFSKFSGSLYAGSFMSLLEGYGFDACRKEREMQMQMLSISQDTGLTLTPDINPEICSGKNLGGIPWSGGASELF